MQLFIKNPTEVNAFNYMAFIEPYTYQSWISLGIFCFLVARSKHAIIVTIVDYEEKI